MLIECRTVLLGIHAHGAELIDIERTAKPTYAFLLEDGRPAILSLDQYVANQEKRRKYNQANSGNNEIDDALHVALDLIHAVKDIAAI
jgi:hypothetical protein